MSAPYTDNSTPEEELLWWLDEVGINYPTVARDAQLAFEQFKDILPVPHRYGLQRSDIHGMGILYQWEVDLELQSPSWLCWGISGHRLELTMYAGEGSEWGYFKLGIVEEGQWEELILENPIPEWVIEKAKLFKEHESVHPIN